jgi:hypothetical protein
VHRFKNPEAFYLVLDPEDVVENSCGIFIQQAIYALSSGKIPSLKRNSIFKTEH